MSEATETPEGENTDVDPVVPEDPPKNPLDISDEDILNMPLPLDEEPTDGDTPTEEEPTPSDDPKTPKDDEDDEDDEEEDTDDKEVTDGDGEGDKPPKTEPKAKKSGDKKETPDDKDDKPSTDDAEEPDYKALFNQVIAPFKANNREIKVDNVDDVRQLMQMGANYNKKMAGLKPRMKILRKLENHGLLDEGKLDFLIDLDKKDPDAITKLIKDSGMDPLNVDTEAKSDYKPKSYNVSDGEALLGEVLDDIKTTDTYEDTINVVSNEWDESSKQVILKEPEIIRTINNHMASGVFGEIKVVMDKERMLGRLNGLSDIEAYKQVGDQMHANKQFSSQKEEAAAATAPVTPPIKKAPVKDDAKTKNRKRAAGGSRSAPGGKSVSSYDPLGMSDEEIEKMDASQFT